MLHAYKIKFLINNTKYNFKAKYNEEFEMFLKKAGVSPADLGTVSPEEFEKLTVGSTSPRGKAKKLRNVQRAGYLKGNLGVIVDGTGDDYEKILKKKEVLEGLGYDTMMLFVNTSLDVAQ